MKKVIILMVIVSLVYGVGARLIKKETAPGVVKDDNASQTIIAQVKDRPYVSLTPRTDGKELTLEISRLKNVDKVEYELMYLSNDLSRGVIGTIDLKGDTSVERKLLLGSCSKNVCKYDENVSEGSLTLRLRSPEGTQKYTSDFVITKGGDEIISKDEKFKISFKLSVSAYYIAMSTIGLPGDIEGEVVGEPYGVFSSGSIAAKNGEVSIASDDTTANLFFWTGKAWQELSDPVSSLSPAYVLIK